MSPPSGSYKAVDVGCPFFKRDDGSHRITCEGLVDKSSITLFFQKKSGFETQMNVFCCKHYQNCEIYEIVMKKYEEDNV